MSIVTPTRTRRVADLELLVRGAPQTTELGRNLQPGSLFEGYRIERILGRGGMGIVYAATDLETDEPFAIKVLGSSIHDTHLVTRFCRESSNVARLQHPNIIRLHTVGQTEEVCYIVMQLIDGVSLREWLNRVPHAAPMGALISSTPCPRTAANVPTFQFRADQLLVEDTGSIFEAVQPVSASSVTSRTSYHQQVVSILLQLLDGIEHAHAIGVIHRDLKPENVMIQPDGRVVIIDFGLARSYADTTITTHSGLIGTPLYMAPEQLQGREVQTTSDLYTIGLMGYEMLTLTVPFRANSIEALLNNVLFAPVVPLVNRNRSVPQALANIIHRAMAKDPAMRYATAREFRDDLERFQKGQPVQASNYQHRFDCHEIYTMRPRRVAVACYSMIAVSGFFFLVAIFSLVSQGKSTIQFLLLAGWYLISALGLQSGRRHAMTLGVLNTISSFLVLELCVYRTAQQGPAAWLPGIVLASLFGTMGTITGVTLLSRKTRHWLARVREKRREFDNER